MRTVRRLFNMLVLLSMALGLVLAPTSSVSADVEGPAAFDDPYDSDVYFEQGYSNPCYARAQAYYRFDFQTKIELTAGQDPIEIQFPNANLPNGVEVPGDLDSKLDSMAIAAVSDGNVSGLNDAEGSQPDHVEYFPPDYPTIYNTYTGTVTVKVFPSETITEGYFVKLEFFGPDRTDPDEPGQGPTPDEYPTIGRPSWPDGTSYPDVADTDGKGWPWWQDDDVGGGTEEGGVYGFDEWDAITPTIPSWANPAGFQIPPELEAGDRYTVGLGLEGEYDPVVFELCSLPPVGLYLKKQIPEDNCNYTKLEKVGDFSEIGAALDAARQIWTQTGAYGADNPKWNLFDGCPNLSGLGADYIGDFDNPTEIPVGAVIAVGSEGSPYSETLEIDVPGVIVGSIDGRENTEIRYGEGVVGHRTQYTAANETRYAGVLVNAGGVTLGESQFGDDADTPFDNNELFGFDINGWYTDTDAVAVHPTDGEHCSENVAVYSSTVAAYGTITATGGNTVTLKVEDGTLVTKTKIVNVRNGWAGYVVSGTNSAGTDITTTLWMTQPLGGGVITPTTTNFDDGDNFVAFAPTGVYSCPDARVDVRGNEIHGADLNGTAAFTTSIWFDSNKVHHNDEDGFYGEDLKACGSLKICDGCGRTDKMLELSNNYIYENGNAAEHANTDADAGWACSTNFPGEFNPEGAGDDSGIDIMSVNPCLEGGVSDHLYIHDNLIEENVHAGIWLQEHAADSGTRILWNELFDNGVFGLSNEANETGLSDDEWAEPTTHSEVDVIFKYNDVTGNGNNYAEDAELEPSELEYTGWGVKNWAADNEQPAYFNAKENFWNFPTCEPGSGDTCVPDVYPGGPSRGPEPCAHELDQRYLESDMRPLGMGDAVDKGTFYNPWLAYEEEDGGFDFDMDYKYLVDESADESDDVPYEPDRKLQSTRPYGSDSLMLQGGWNTLAVPLPLNPNYNTPDELCDLGYFLTNVAGESGIPDRKYEIAYEYDAGDGGWGSAPTFMPPQGYYIKMKEATRFPVIYGAETPVQLPSFSLFADNPADEYKNGWNLVGANFGIDYEDDNPGWDDQGRFAVADPDDAAGEGSWSWQWVTPTLMAEELDFAFEVEDALEEKLRMYGEDDWYQIGQAWMPIKFAFNAIDPAGVSGGAANITSPGMAAQIDGGWSLPWDAVEGRPVFAGQAYWVFMREDGALNGFEQAPLFMEVSLR